MKTERKYEDYKLIIRRNPNDSYENPSFIIDETGFTLINQKDINRIICAGIRSLRRTQQRYMEYTEDTEILPAPSGLEEVVN